MTIPTPHPATVAARAGTLTMAATMLTLSLAGGPARAQFSAPPPDQPDMSVTAAIRAATVDSLAAALERSYVFPDVANKTADALRAKLKSGGYSGLDQAKAFADSLTADLRAIGKDRHFRVGYWHRELPEGAFTDRGPSPEERARLSIRGQADVHREAQAALEAAQAAREAELSRVQQAGAAATQQARAHVAAGAQEKWAVAGAGP